MSARLGDVVVLDDDWPTTVQGWQFRATFDNADVAYLLDTAMVSQRVMVQDYDEARATFVDNVVRHFGVEDGINGVGIFTWAVIDSEPIEAPVRAGAR